MAKARTSNDGYDNGDWIVWHKDLTSGNFLRLNSNAAQDSESSSNTLIATATSGSQHQVVVNNGYANTSGNGHYLNSGPDNGTGEEYILYGWAGVEGYSRFGTYTGNGSSSNGPMVYTGFRPGWLLVKKLNSESWILHDTARSPFNVSSNKLSPNSSNAESSSTFCDFLSPRDQHR